MMLSGWIRPLGRALALVFALTGAAVADTATAGTKEGDTMTRIHVFVDGELLSATLDDTPAGRDFAALLPLELTLTDYHGIEKVADLPRELDTTDAPASYRPEIGDITLYAPWGNLAIFCKPFQRSRGLVRLGAFDGSIEALVRNGDIPVRIEMAP